MPLILYAHPFSSYCWKVLIALYEAGLAFELRVLDGAAAMAELEALWPLRKFPVLRDGEDTVIESTIIVEHLARRFPMAAALMPEDAVVAERARFLDRVFDNYLESSFQKVVGDRLRPEGARDAYGVAEARTMLRRTYAWLETALRETWAVGETFSLADCSGAPALFYADWVEPIGEAFPAVRAYRARLLARPAVARVVDEARPYRHFFPGGAPDRD